jgi:hypothetical protein
MLCLLSSASYCGPNREHPKMYPCQYVHFPLFLSRLFNYAVCIRLYSAYGSKINEYGAVGGMRICRRNRSTGRKLPQCHLVHHKPHMTWPRSESEPPR